MSPAAVTLGMLTHRPWRGIVYVASVAVALYFGIGSQNAWPLAGAVENPFLFVAPWLVLSVIVVPLAWYPDEESRRSRAAAQKAR